MLSSSADATNTVVAMGLLVIVSLEFMCSSSYVSCQIHCYTSNYIQAVNVLPLQSNGIDTSCVCWSEPVRNVPGFITVYQHSQTCILHRKSSLQENVNTQQKGHQLWHIWTIKPVLKTTYIKREKERERERESEADRQCALINLFHLPNE